MVILLQLDADGNSMIGGLQSGSPSTQLTHFFATLDRPGEYFFTSEGFDMRRICTILVTPSPSVIPEPSFQLLPRKTSIYGRFHFLVLNHPALLAKAI